MKTVRTHHQKFAQIVLANEQKWSFVQISKELRFEEKPFLKRLHCINEILTQQSSKWIRLCWCFQYAAWLKETFLVSGTKYFSLSSAFAVLFQITWLVHLFRNKLIFYSIFYVKLKEKFKLFYFIIIIFFFLYHGLCSVLIVSVLIL